MRHPPSGSGRPTVRPVTAADQVPVAYRGTPIERLLAYHNLEAPHGDHEAAELLVGMCMDHRKRLRLPSNFAYVIRTGGADLRRSEFHISYAIGVGGVRALALVGHDGCGMVNLEARRSAFVRGLVERAGWEAERADRRFSRLAPLCEIGDEVAFLRAEAKRLRASYPRILVAPLLYRLEDALLCVVPEA